MKYFITDIHGEFNGMDLLLQEACIDFSKDQLVFGGDYINRGKSSGQVIRRVKELVEAYPNNVFALMGNHEEMMRDYYRSGDRLWMSHGGRETLKDLTRTFSQAEMDQHIEWVINLPMVHQDDEFVYTHAGLNPWEPLEEQCRDILWMSESDFYGIAKESLFHLTQNKPVVHGHTPVERIYYDGVRLNADLGCNTYFIEEERGLALIDLSRMIYMVYKQSSGKIEKREITRF
ncbi:metallophosphoesterase family protein [Paenibacillus xylaniclasticus]|uniref:metallophosphoesterase family protein n=1 Tax=Paenibacillus xylaniclasticus TaxID=588083 RepID=UPI000FDC8BDA|nr:MULTISPECIES: metallophosphoesterase family protein [Paenibacillus]GFN33368.1 serine/threonine protein phosphatase [Paenibacillus curdlanolyticus]